jgi:uncharacterized protein (DUF362 family)/Pyruvate/2-oxoacid:ferredoxin oxidoreductase delta subunit
MPRVCITKVEDQDVYKAVKACFDKIVTKDLLTGVKKALIKPNFVVGLPACSGATTDLRIVESLAKILRENGIEVIVGESSLENTSNVLEVLSVLELEKLGVKVVNFDEEKWIEVQSSTNFAPTRFHLPEAVLNCDLIVSVAKMKTHDLTGVTLSVKNVLGMIQKIDRKTAHRVDIDKAIVSVFAYLVRNKKFISFVDGIYAMEGKGSPTHGMPVKMDLIVAGDDAVATDATCIEIMGLEVKNIRHLSLSRKIGLGEIKGREIIGEKIESVRRRFEMPPAIRSSRPFLVSYVTKKFFNRTSSLKYKEKCIKCRLCIENCPIGNITMERDEIKIHKKKCIGCMVCLESCKEGALDYEINHAKIHKIARAIYHKFKKR